MKSPKTIQRNPYSTSLAKHDPATCAVNGLFRTYAPGDYVEVKNGELQHEIDEGGNQIHDEGAKSKPKRQRPGYTVKHTFNNVHIEYVVPIGLGADDLKVFQGLIALATHELDTKVLKSLTASQDGRELRKLFNLEGESGELDCMEVRTTYYQLAKEIGYKNPDGGSVIQQIESCLKRLFCVTVFISDKQECQKYAGYRLVSRLVGKDKSIVVGLNPSIATAVMNGGTGAGYTHINMAEVRQIKADGTRILHQRLCQMIRLGAYHSYSVDSLCSYIWPEPAEPKSQKCRQRQSAVKKFLQEISTCEWKIEETRHNIFKITRPDKKS